MRALRSYMVIVDEKQKNQQDRIAELEDNVDRAHEGVDELKKHLVSLIGARSEASSRAQDLTALEMKLASPESGLATHKTTFDQFRGQVEGQQSANRCGINTLTADVDELFEKVHDEDGNNLMETLAKLNEDFEAKMKGWVEWKESLNRRVPKLEQCDEDDDWVDADLKCPGDAESKT